jgi:hypothetical protein
MNKPIRIQHPLLKVVNIALIDLPSPSSNRKWWTFGSLLGLCSGVQIITGVFFLAINDCPNIELAWLNRIECDLRKMDARDTEDGNAFRTF